MLGCRLVPDSRNLAHSCTYSAAAASRFLQNVFSHVSALQFSSTLFTFFSSNAIRTNQVDKTPGDLDKQIGLLATADQRTAVVNDTILFLPYCTGDVHAGQKFTYITF